MLPSLTSPISSAGSQSPAKIPLLFQSASRIRKNLKTIGVVFEIGEAFSKIGFAGESQPRHIFRTDNFGQSRELRLTTGQVPLSAAAWQAVLDRWLHRIFFEKLCRNPSDQPVFIVENVFWPYTFKQALAQALFVMEVPGIMFLPGPTLPIYTTGLRDGLVIDIGFREIRVLPICAGFPVYSALSTAALGWQDIKDTLLRDLSSSPSYSSLRPLLTQPSTLDSLVLSGAVAQSLSEAKEGKGETQVEAGGQTAASPIAYVLGLDSKGQDLVVTLTRQCRLAMGDTLFGKNPEVLSLSELVMGCLHKCSPDVRAAITQNIVMAGATSLIPGTSNRLHQEISALCDLPEYREIAGLKGKFKFATTAFPKNLLTWLGGSIVASLSPEELYTPADLNNQIPIPDWTQFNPPQPSSSSPSALTSSTSAAATAVAIGSPLTERRRSASVSWLSSPQSS
eukprot:gb/GEZN01008366.1/.p1 GENE.gb/GEZN01008366.1/~~gb/GEZN01008366.1/.p1  ORF type:complete len:452 (-),score=55.92 gb/GEZN01008366.1/:20-1375(-)